MSAASWEAAETRRAGDTPVHPDRVCASLGRLAGVRASLDAEELTLIQDARAEGVPWRTIAGALGLGSAQGAWQRAQRLGRRGHGPQGNDGSAAAEWVAFPRSGGGRPTVVGSSTPAPAVAERIEQSLIRLLGSGENFASLNVEQLLVGAGVARSTFYAYFGDKLAVLLVVGRHAISDVIREATAWSSLPDGAGREDLRAAVDRIVRSYHVHAPVLAAMAESASFDPRTRAEMRKYLNTARVDVTRHARAQQKRGSVRDDVDVAVTMGWLLAMFEQGLYRYVRSARADQLDMHIDAVTDLIWFALYAGAPERS